MALPLDLEEQEQVDQLKHFWKQYGDLITWVLIGVFGFIALWNGWIYWQRTQATNASILFDEVTKSVASRDAAKIERAFQDMKERFGRTTLAHQAGLLSAKSLYDLEKHDQAQAALQWVADNSADEGHQAIAKLRLSAIFLEKKSYDEALKTLSSIGSSHFVALAADRRGDILMAQGQPAAAKLEYEKAFKAMDEEIDYRRLVEAKLNAMGVDVSAMKASVNPAGTHSGTPASEGKK